MGMKHVQDLRVLCDKAGYYSTVEASESDRTTHMLYVLRDHTKIDIRVWGDNYFVRVPGVAGYTYFRSAESAFEEVSSILGLVIR